MVLEILSVFLRIIQIYIFVFVHDLSFWFLISSVFMKAVTYFLQNFQIQIFCS